MGKTSHVRRNLLLGALVAFAVFLGASASFLPAALVGTPADPLTITEKNLPPTGNAVAGQKNILLKRFEARAGTDNDIRLIAVKFIANKDVAANGRNYSLWVDTDADQIADTPIQGGMEMTPSPTQPAAGRVVMVISGAGHFIPRGTSQIFELRADVASTISSAIFLRMWFDTPQAGYSAEQKQYVMAKKANNQNDSGTDLQGINTAGACATTCEIFVNSLPSTVWYLSDVRLDIAMQDLGASGTAVTNQQQILLQRFKATASGNDDAFFTSMTFLVNAGDELNARNYVLLVDTDNDGKGDYVLEGGLSPVSGRVKFDVLDRGGYTVTRAKPVIFDVRADVSPTLSPSKFLRLWVDTPQAGYTATQLQYVTAKRVSNGQAFSGIATNGACAVLPCQIFVTGGAPIGWTLSDDGSIPPPPPPPPPTVIMPPIVAPPAPACGNGIAESPEECDDGNVVIGDACGGLCNSEKDLITQNIGANVYSSKIAQVGCTYFNKTGCQQYVAFYGSNALVTVEYYPVAITNQEFQTLLPTTPMPAGQIFGVSAFQGAYYWWGAQPFVSDTSRNYWTYAWYKGRRIIKVQFVNMPQNFMDFQRMDDLFQAYMGKHGSGLQHLTSVCGNKIAEVIAGELCDDGNTANGDGCSSTCKTENSPPPPPPTIMPPITGNPPPPPPPPPPGGF